MENVTFSEEAVGRPQSTYAPKKGIAQNLIKWGFAKDEAGANYVMIGLIVVCALLAIAVPLLFLGSGSELPPQSVIDAKTPPSNR